MEPEENKIPFSVLRKVLKRPEMQKKVWSMSDPISKMRRYFTCDDLLSAYANIPDDAMVLVYGEILEYAKEEMNA